MRNLVEAGQVLLVGEAAVGGDEGVELAFGGPKQCAVLQATPAVPNDGNSLGRGRFGGAGNGHTGYIFVTGGVVSSIGKGTSAAALGMLLKSRGYKVVLQKFDRHEGA